MSSQISFECSQLCIPETIKVAKAQTLPYLHLHAKSIEYVEAIGPAAAHSPLELVRASASMLVRRGRELMMIAVLVSPLTTLVSKPSSVLPPVPDHYLYRPEPGRCNCVRKVGIL